MATLLVADMWVRHTEPALRSYDVALIKRTINAFHRQSMPPIILMGSSRACYGLVPEEFTLATGKRSYNVGLSASMVGEWQALARCIFAEAKPQLVVLGINGNELRADYQPTMAASHFFNLDDVLDHCLHDGPSAAVIGGYLHRRLGPIWAAFQRRYELKLWCQERIARLLPKHAQRAREVRKWAVEAFPPDGFNHPWLFGKRLRTLADKLAGDPTQVWHVSTPLFSPRAGAFRRLGELLAWFRQERIRVLVVYLPNSPMLEKRCQEVEPRMIAEIDRICREHATPFLKCSLRDVPRLDSDFLDETHVGLPLARRISRRAAEEVVALGLLERMEQKLAESGGVDAAP